MLPPQFGAFYVAGGGCRQTSGKNNYARRLVGGEARFDMVAEFFRQTLIGFYRRQDNRLNNFTANFVFNSNHSYHYARGKGMKHYTEMVQGPEFAGRERGYTFVSHQQEVGAGYFDDVIMVIQGGASSVMALCGSTEEAQFERAVAK